MKKAIPVIAIFGLLTAAPLAHAAAPQLVPVQGVLTDSAGDPIDSSVTAIFSLYTSEVGGTALWTETQSVLVEDGLFTAYMGDETALDLTTFRDNGNLWLGITIGSDAEMDRVMLGSNPFAAYSEWCGNHPTPDFADITGSVDPADLPSGVVVGALSCSGTQKVSGVDSSGALVCSADVDTDTDTDTTYTAGSGLSLAGTTFSVDMSGIQARVTGICTAGNSIRQINSDGTVICEPDTDTDTNTTYSAGSGLDLSGTTFLVDPTDFNGSNPALDSYSSATVTSSGSTTVTLRQATITAPVGGRVLAIGKSDTICGSCASGESTYGYMTVSASASASAMSGSFSAFYVAHDTTYEMDPQVVMEVFNVGAGTFTYYLRGYGGTSETLSFVRNQLMLFFIPN